MKIIQDLARKNKVSVYLVGGFLRDYVIRRPNCDLDFAVEKNALKLARRFARLVKGTFVLLDRERGCARVVQKLKGQTSTFDFADFRAPTIKKDIRRRDFTVNTLCLDVLSLDGEKNLDKILLDYKNGKKDVRARRIRMVSPRSFQDDPLRLLRAFSLRAMLEFQIDRPTLVQIKKDRERIQMVSVERVWEELFKILQTSRAGETFKAMDRIGLLEQVIPEIRVMADCPQGGYHHLDVWPHSLQTVVELDKIFKEAAGDQDTEAYLGEVLGGNHPRAAVVKLAALLHDIGKPRTRKQEQDRLSFHGHEHVGKSIVRKIARRLKISTPERHALENMVMLHLRPGYLSNFQNPSRRMIFRYFRDTKENAVSILLLSLADQRATRGPLTSARDQKHHEAICRRLMKEYFAKKKEKPFVRLIGGRDLIKEIKLKPSPLFGEILSAVEEQQTLGKIKTKEEALKLARKIVQKKKNGKGAKKRK